MNLPNLATINGLLTLRLVVWFSGILIAPFVLEKLLRDDEIGGEVGYLKSLVLSLFMFAVAFLPFLLPRIFLLLFSKKLMLFFSILWAFVFSALCVLVLCQVAKISYVKGLLVWILTVIVSSTAALVLVMFSLALFRLTK
jgi:hypothetical protein